MNRTSGYLFATALLATLLAAGCAQRAVKPAGTDVNPAPSPGPTEQPGSSASSQPPPGKTGIPACDDYLASYKACHRAAGIYSPETIDRHYRVMRDTLLTESRRRSSHSALAGRCVALANLLKKALHGKSCTPPTPASASSSP
ncbi:MAG TPA: hypothetical protein VFJ15_07175 [Oleiagrimonas sp.]|nr:hypothetical protein [Oleiagrimonas sp.]